jgi:hypothetical protein
MVSLWAVPKATRAARPSGARRLAQREAWFL